MSYPTVSLKVRLCYLFPAPNGVKQQDTEKVAFAVYSRNRESNCIAPQSATLFSRRSEVVSYLILRGFRVWKSGKVGGGICTGTEVCWEQAEQCQE